MKILVTALAFMLFAFTTNAQDTIFKKDGSEISAKVLEISKTEVKFKKSENLDGPTYTEYVKDLRMIMHPKGVPPTFFDDNTPMPGPPQKPTVPTPTTTVVEYAPTPRQAPQPEPEPRQTVTRAPRYEPSPTVNEVNTDSNSDKMCDKGAQDARVFYTGKNCGSGWVSALSVLASPLTGLITAAVVVGTKPSYDNLSVPTPSLLRNADYMGCYQNEAYKIKKKKVWQGWGIGSAAFLIVYLLVGSSAK
jgi:hypothetical protein